ncbi:MAG: cobalt-precorrin 5A hydrolase [Desulfobacterales bacterium]
MKTKPSIAVWTLTSGGARIADRIAESRHGKTVVYIKSGISSASAAAVYFENLKNAVARAFHQHRGHIFVMAAGIAVRMIAPHIHSKTRDPAVLVVDDAGCFVISLLSGHLGGANAMTRAVARSIGAKPVITTATDNAGVPAIDLLADQYGLAIENMAAAKVISMAFLFLKQVWRHDPYGILDTELTDWTSPMPSELTESAVGIYIDHRVRKLPAGVLTLRPLTLVVGMGCNSGTAKNELVETVCGVFEREQLSLSSIRGFATISDKLTEPGLCAMADHLGRPLAGFDRGQLSSVADVPNPSECVKKYMGVSSVCEAAAILGAASGRLVVPKQKQGNVTMAVAAVPSISSASDRGTSPTCPVGQGK